MSSTYQDGFTVTTDCVTTKDIVDVCRHIEKTLGVGYMCLPEAITEGGIMIVTWPGLSQRNIREGTLKTLRFRFLLHSDAGKWPCLNPLSVRDEWSSSPPKVIWESIADGDTIIKALGDAPAWTVSELQAFKTAFEEQGWICGPTPILKIQ